MQQEKNLIGIELLKFLAALMITNSHLKPFYVDPFTPIGTLGAPGNALFFFVSGYTLMIGRFDNFNHWYKRRIQRIFPSLLIWTSLLSPIITNSKITIESIWLANDYWFIKCIMIYYILWWIIKRYFITKLLHIVILSIIISICIFIFALPITKHSIYINQFHYFCFFSIFILGSYIATKEKYRTLIHLTNFNFSFLMASLSLAIFYLIQYIGKGKTGNVYYFQIISIFPLHTFIYYTYLIAMSSKVENILQRKWIKKIVTFIGKLTLEIYIVGFTLYLIPKSINVLFPINIIIVITFVIILASSLKIVSSLFLNIIANKDFKIKELFYNK